MKKFNIYLNQFLFLIFLILTKYITKKQGIQKKHSHLFDDLVFIIQF